MRIRNFKDEKLKEYTIVNDSGWTRSGFFHKSTLLRNNSDIEESKINYINRTWECYPFQTSMMSVVSKAKDYWVKYYTNKFKADNNYTKLTAKRKEELEEYLNTKEEIIKYNLMYKELELHHC